MSHIYLFIFFVPCLLLLDSSVWMCAVMQIYPTMLNLLIKIYSFHPLKGHQRTQVCTVICYLKFSQVAITEGLSSIWIISMYWRSWMMLNCNDLLQTVCCQQLYLHELHYPFSFSLWLAAILIFMAKSSSIYVGQIPRIY